MRGRGRFVRALAAAAGLLVMLGAIAAGATAATAQQPSVPVPTAATLTLLTRTLDSYNRAGLVYDPQLYAKLRKQLGRAQTELAAADAQFDVQQFADTLQQQLDQIANSNGKRTGDPPSINASSAQTLINLSYGAPPPTSFTVAPTATAPAVVASVVATTPVTVTVPAASTIATVTVTPPPPATPLPPPPRNGTTVSSLIVTAATSTGTPVTTLTTPAPVSSTFSVQPPVNPFSATFQTFDPVTGAAQPLATTVVANPDGTYTATASTPHFSTFVVTAGRPTVTSVTPVYGPVAGGTLVQIGGFSMQNPSRVLFGGVDGTNVTFANNQLTALAPAAASAGPATVQVVAGGQYSDPVNAPQFTYYAPLTATASFAPSTVYTGDQVTLNAFSSGGYGPVTFAWTYSEGGGAAGATVTRPYNSAGTFTATVVATDSIGNSSAPVGLTINVVLPTISGAVTDSVSGAVLAGVTVEVDSFIQVPGDGIDAISPVATTTTDASGKWSAAVPNGAYKVRALQTSDHAGRWLGNTYRGGKSTTVNVNAAPVSGQNIALEAGFQVGGTVFLPDGVTGEPGVSISSWLSGSGAPLGLGQVTGSGGTYTITLPNGSSAILDASPPAGYLEQQWNNGAPITAAQTANFTLVAGDVIQGHVYFPASPTGVRWVNVNAFVQGQGGIAGGQTDASGLYQLTVPTGGPATYPLRFSPLNDGSSGSPAPVWSGGVTNAFGATGVGHGSTPTTYDITLPAGFRVNGAIAPGQAGIQNQVWDFAQAPLPGFPPLANAFTDGSGNYSFLVPPGSYSVHLNANNAGGLLQAWYQNASGPGGATKITVTNADVGLGPVALAQGYAISGTISPGQAGVNVNVSLPPPAGGCCPQFVAGGQTGPGGGFSVLVPNGTYIIGFFPQPSTHLMQEWWGGGSDASRATPIPVSNAPYPLGTITLQSGNRIQGTLSPAPPNGKWGFCVQNPGGGCVAGGGVQNGVFDVVVPPGRYVLVFNPPAPYLQAQVTVDASAGDVLGLSVPLTTGFVLQGTVTGPGGSLVAGAKVNVQAAVCCQGYGAQSDQNGSWSLALPAGSYLVQVQPPPGSSLVAQWYPGVSGQSQATALPVDAAHNPASAPLSLPAGFHLTGQVQNQLGGGLGGVEVDVFVDRGFTPGPTFFPAGKGDPNLGDFVAGGQTDGAGNFSVVVPAGGGYVVTFVNPPPGSLPAAVTATASADPTSVGTVKLPAGVVLSGTVTQPGSPSPVGAPGVSVTAYQAGFCCEAQRQAQTDQNGNYQLTVDNNANWLVQFSPGGGKGGGGGSQLAPVYWDGTANGTGAPTRATVVNSGSPPAGLNVALQQGQKITGTVSGSDTGGVGLPGIPVSLQDQNTVDTCCYPQVEFTPTGPDGSFTFWAPPGSWLVQAGGNPGSAYLHGYYSSGGMTFDAHQATPVPAGSTTPASFVLQRGVTVTGTVRSGSAVVGGVNLWPTLPAADGTCCAGANLPGTQTGGDGTYSLLVPSGSAFYLNVNPPPGYLQQTIPVPAGTAVQDVALTSGSVISGVVTDASILSGPNGVSGIGVFAWDANVCCGGPNTQTDAAGSYSLTVPDGNWIVGFTPPPGKFAPAFWDGSATGAVSPLKAARIPVSGSSVAGRNVALVAGSVLSGTVSGGGSPLAGVWVRLNDPAQVNTCCYPAINQMRTLSDGSFSLAVPAAGAWAVQVQPDPGVAFLGGWYSSSGLVYDPLLLSTVGPGPGLAIALPQGYPVSGRVTIAGNTSSTPGLGRVGINANLGSRADGTCCVVANSTTTLPDGTYSFYAPAGTYSLDLFPPTGYLGTSVPITVTTAGVSGENVTVSAGTVVHGQVVSNANSLPVSGVNVVAYDAGPPCCGPGFWGRTDTAGDFQVTVPTGHSYLFDLQPPASSSLAPQWYTGSGTGSPTQAGAVAVAVGTPDLTLNQTRLVGGTVLSGTLRGATTGNPAVNVYVRADQTGGGGPPASQVNSDGAGHWALTVPTDGTTYRLSFGPPLQPNGFLGGSVVSGATVGGAQVLDANLTDAHEVYGNVTSGSPPLAVQGVSVRAWNGATQVGSGTTDAAGNYGFMLAAQSTVTLQFDGSALTPPRGNVWYSATVPAGVATQAAATPVTMNAAQVINQGV